MNKVAETVIITAVTFIETGLLQTFISFNSIKNFLSEHIGPTMSKPINLGVVEASLSSIIICIVLLVICFIISYYLFKIICSLVKRRKEKKFKSCNYLDLPDFEGVHVEFTPYIGDSCYKSGPFASDVKIYCDKHAFPREMIFYSGCQECNCPNHNLKIDKFKVEMYVNDYLLNKYKEIF